MEALPNKNVQAVAVVVKVDMNVISSLDTVNPEGITSCYMMSVITPRQCLHSSGYVPIKQFLTLRNAPCNRNKSYHAVTTSLSSLPHPHNQKHHMLLPIQASSFQHLYKPPLSPRILPSIPNTSQLPTKPTQSTNSNPPQNPYPHSQQYHPTQPPIPAQHSSHLPHQH